MEGGFIDVNERCFITVTSAMDYKPWVPSLQAVEPLPLRITRCLGVLTNIPVFTFFPWTVSLTKTLLAMLDWLSQKWLMAQL